MVPLKQATWIMRVIIQALLLLHTMWLQCQIPTKLSQKPILQTSGSLLTWFLILQRYIGFFFFIIWANKETWDWIAKFFAYSDQFLFSKNQYWNSIATYKTLAPYLIITLKSIVGKFSHMHSRDVTHVFVTLTAGLCSSTRCCVWIFS